MPDAVQSSPMRRAFRAARAARVALARSDINAFCSFVLRDEETGKPIGPPAELHRTWHQILDKHSRVVVWSFISSAKTQQISVGRTLFELGKNPGLRIVIVSNTAQQAEKIVRQIGQYLQRSSELRQMFPSLRPSVPW